MDRQITIRRLLAMFMIAGSGAGSVRPACHGPHGIGRIDAGNDGRRVRVGNSRCDNG